MDDISRSIYDWVLAEVRKGTLLDEERQAVRRLSLNEILSHGSLKDAYSLQFYRNLSGILAISNGDTDPQSRKERAKSLVFGLTGSSASVGKETIDDSLLLTDMVEDVFVDGLPEDIYTEVSVWEALTIPQEVKIQPIARRCLVFEKVHNIDSASLRLKRKFEKHYMLIVARYLLSEQLEWQVNDALKDTERAFLKAGIPFERFQGI